MTEPTSRQLKRTLALARALKFGRPILKILGVDLEKYIDPDEMIRLATALVESTEPFNDLFADRGWIAYGWQKPATAKAAISLARRGNFDEAEKILAESLTPNSVNFWLGHLANLRCFKNRMPLARLAAMDYAEGRYHACVPVVLAMMDGMGQELTGAGFLRQGCRFVDDDSFLALGPGMGRLVRTLTASRGGTTTAAIQIPFRHGILHGVDLNYANQLVAAKSWAALFAAGYYAKTVEDTQAKKPERAGLLETWNDLARTQGLQHHLDTWQPRTQPEIQRAIQTVQPGTPEARVSELLEAWTQGNFGAMAKTTFDSRQENFGALAGRIRKNLPSPPEETTTIDVVDDAPAAAWVTVKLAWPDFSDDVRLRLIYYDESDVAPSNSGKGDWFFVSLWPLEGLRAAMAATTKRA